MGLPPRVLCDAVGGVLAQDMTAFAFKQEVVVQFAHQYQQAHNLTDYAKWTGATQDYAVKCGNE